MTICERCGSERHGIAEECPACHFEPKSRRELARAALLTTEFRTADGTWGTPQPTLEVLAGDIRVGNGLALSAESIRRHEAAVSRLVAVAPSDGTGSSKGLSLPMVGFLFGIVTVLVVLWLTR